MSSATVSFQAFLDATTLPKGDGHTEFLNTIFETVQQDCPDLLSFTQLRACADSLWAAGQDLPKSGSRVDLVTGVITDAQGQALDVINVITTDKPFLVVSVTGEIAARGIAIEALFHPITRLDGHTLSIMQIIVPRQSGQVRTQLRQSLTEIVEDISVVTQDYNALKNSLKQARAQLQECPGDTPDRDLSEALAFLEWLSGNHFVFMGARTYDFTHMEDLGDGAVEPAVVESSNFGLLRNPNLQVLRDTSEPTRVSPQGRVLFDEAETVIIAKSNLG